MDVVIKTMEMAEKLKGSKILLAEDHSDHRFLFAMVLKMAGATVDVAENGSVAIAMYDAASLEDRSYDLLLVDLRMPELDGKSLTSLVRIQNTAIPIIALTANALASEKQDCLAVGFNDFVPKPVANDLLVSICEKWIHRATTSSPDASSP